MRNWIASWVASVLALAVVIFVIMGKVENLGLLLITAVVLGLVNSLIRPIVMFFAWPVNCLTFGLFGFVLNVVLFAVVVGALIPGFGQRGNITGALAALVGSVAMGVLSGVFGYILKEHGRS